MFLLLKIASPAIGILHSCEYSPISPNFKDAKAYQGVHTDNDDVKFYKVAK